MQNNGLLPIFIYDLNHISGKNLGCIMAGQEVVHRIKDTAEFYKALGYKDDMNENGVLPEEFVWAEYHKDGAKKSEFCLQASIVEYLCKNVEGFKHRYGNAYRNLIGSCKSDVMNDSAECKNCKMYPLIQKYC